MGSIRALLLTGGALHDEPSYYSELAGALAGEGGVDLRMTRDLDALAAATLEPYDVVINTTTFVDAEAGQVEALLESVRGGTGLVALHGGNATFWNSPDYLRALGSRFLRHPPIKRFRVHIEDPAHPIVDGVGDFEVEDELFEIGGDVSRFEEFTKAFGERGWSDPAVLRIGEGPLQPDITVLASSESQPLLYTRTLGTGRIHYNALGHEQSTLRNESYRRLLLQGVRWAADRDETG